MRRFQKSIVIDRPISVVFAYLSHFENEAKWMPNVVSTRRISGDAPAVGTRYLEVSNFFPLVRNKSVYELTEYIPDKKISFKSISGPMRFTGSCLVEPTGNGTRFTYTLDMHLRGLSLLEPLLKRIFARRAEWGFSKLKSHLESPR